MPTNKEILEQIVDVIGELKYRQELTQNDVVELKIDIVRKIGESDLKKTKEIGQIVLSVEKNMNAMKDGIARSLERHKNDVSSDIKEVDKRMGEAETKVSLINQKVAFIVAVITLLVNGAFLVVQLIAK